MVVSIPITNHEGDLAVRVSEGERDTILVIDYDRTETTGGSLEVEGREVEEAPDLIFDLEAVSEVPLGRDGAVGAEDAVLPRVTPHLDPVPFIYFQKVNVGKIIKSQRGKKKDDDDDSHTT